MLPGVSAGLVDLLRSQRKHHVRSERPYERHGECHKERWRDDPTLDFVLQSHETSRDHSRTHRDHFGRCGSRGQGVNGPNVLFHILNHIILDF